MTPLRPDSRDQERLALWVREHSGAVRGFLLSLVRRADVADDLCQEVFRRAWQAKDTYKEQGATRAYLLKIADRLVCDLHRRAQREVQLDDGGWRQVEPAGPEPEPADLLTHAEAQQELAAALECLTPVQRRVLLLRYYGSLSFQEIAQSLDCPLATALSHARRGLLALRKLLVEK